MQQLNPVNGIKGLHLGVRLQVLIILEHTSDLISIDQYTCDHTASRLCAYTEETGLLEIGKGLGSIALDIERRRDKSPHKVLPEIDRLHDDRGYIRTRVNNLRTSEAANERLVLATRLSPCSCTRGDIQMTISIAYRFICCTLILPSIVCANELPF